MSKKYILFTVNGEVHFIMDNNNVGISGELITNSSNYKCSFHVKGLRKLPTTRILENLLTNMISSVLNNRLTPSDIHPEEKVRELFETPDNLVELIRELPGVFNLREKVRRAWIL